MCATVSQLRTIPLSLDVFPGRGRLVESHQLANICQTTRQCRRRGHSGRHKVGAAFIALTPFEVPGRGLGTALFLGQLIRVHGKAHRTPAS